METSSTTALAGVRAVTPSGRIAHNDPETAALGRM